jgi:hypothetical protein
MKKILYANGDSFVAGMECLDHGDRSDLNKELAFSKHLATALNCEIYINNAYNGATNEFIFKRTIFDLQELERNNVDPTDVFVVIGFTSLRRFEIDGARLFEGYKDSQGNPLGTVPSATPVPPDEFIDYGTVFMSPSNVLLGADKKGKIVNMLEPLYPFITRYLWTDPVLKMSHAARIHALHAILKLKGYQHVIINTCTDEVELPDGVNFFSPPLVKSFYEYALRFYPDELRSHNHFSPLPHAKYAEELITHIRDKVL